MSQTNSWQFLAIKCSIACERMHLKAKMLTSLKIQPTHVFGYYFSGDCTNGR